MSSSLYAALSSLQAHQSWIDLIGNNLANSNTAGFKGSQAIFSAQFAQTLNYASGPSTGRGGRNPTQVGLGVRFAATSRNLSQGSLTTTGRVFDLALQGNGYFAVRSGLQNLYTRAGSFGLDANHFLVDQRTGAQVISPGGSPIQIDTDSLLSPSATTTAQMAGNLPKVVTGPLPEVLSSSEAFADGSPATLTSSNAGPYTIPTGETWTMKITVNGSAPQTVSLTSTTGSVTAQDVVDAINAFDGVSASVNGSGGVSITSNGVGENVTLKVTAGTSGRDLAELLGVSTSLVTGSQTAVTSSTELNNLPGNTTDYVDGDTITITGVDTDGTAINSTFTYGAANDGTTLQELVDFVDAQFPGATVSLDASGKLVVQADTAGVTDLQLSLLDGSAATGTTDWTRYAMSVTTEGTAPDTVATAMEVFDPAGVAHTLTLSFERQDDGTWNISPSLESSDGSVISGPITGLRFGDDGSPTGLGGVDPAITLSFNGQSSPQTVNLNLGTDGVFTGLTQFGAAGEVLVSTQDGYGVGQLASMSVSSDGSVMGLYTNGQQKSLGAIGIATFTNPEGLSQTGDNLFAESTNSGAAQISAGGTGRAGSVVGGALENSNIDTAEQFVNLIEAQRGFQANSRVITVQNELMRDLTQIV
ncbi:MAG: flagellar hook-basal body complex protein [Planctomycetes bacterium]|nr:flagellar hook-basal body complex protein [Planctomycetota bacterium]